MIFSEHGEYGLFVAPEITLAEDCLNKLTTAMKALNLESACPLFPKYHRKLGVFERNYARPYGAINNELHRYCIVVRLETLKKFHTLDVHSANFLTDYRNEMLRLNIKHALVCNALIYGRE